jgi:2-methylcitrate dehydratase PrpD
VLTDGRTISRHTRFPPGTKENPLDTETLNAKARDLMGPVLGSQRTEAAIRQFNALEQVKDVGEVVRSVLTI